MSRHGGNLRELARDAGRAQTALLDFSANINPLGPPDCLRPAVSLALEQVAHYPDPESHELVEAIARHAGAPAERIVVGNGSTELLFTLARSLSVPSPGTERGKRRRAVVPVPCYVDYITAAREADMEIAPLSLDERAGFALDWSALEKRLRGGEMVFLGQPNNPTGLAFDAEKFRAFAAAHPDTTFVVDEAFAEFVADYATLMRDVGANVIVLRSLTKFYAIPGLRLGFAVARAETAETLRHRLPPWSVNTLAQAAGVAVLADADYALRTREYVRAQRESLSQALREMPGLVVYPGAANFLLLRLNRADLDAPTLARRLLENGIAVRTFPPALLRPPEQRSCEEREQHLDGRFFRIAVRTEGENARFCAALAGLLTSDSSQTNVLTAETQSAQRTNSAPNNSVLSDLCASAVKTSVQRRAARLMFQGTSSNAGKSILTAALCRILLQDGVRVAPFKAQNMSLNSFVTRDGGEMGRAQVVQAQACRLEPDVRMNPVLLKPNSDAALRSSVSSLRSTSTGCQVIVRGRAVGNMGVAGYDQYKPRAIEAVEACYDALASEFDAVVLEGAGSPGEVNLKSRDIVNMRMAKYARSPVLVVGDIDRGGVFAAFVGTMEVLAQWERALIAGWVVNRFRGDAALLRPALDYTLAHTGRPVFGVVPYLQNLGLPEEDSVEFKSGALDDRADRAEAVTVAVVDLPHISNFTDFDALRVEADVSLCIVRTIAELGEPDAVILPGSKNVLHDLHYLRQSGLAERLLSLARGGRTEIVGICGGLQLLGREIRDPCGIESGSGGDRGLGLLNVVTIMASEKTLMRAEATHGPSGCRVVGYEIHHGRTAAEGPVLSAVEGPALSLVEGVEVILRRSDGEAVGFAAGDHRVWGTYLHGIFDADAFRRWFIDRLRVRRGWEPKGAVSARYDIEPALDRLAQAVRESLDMERIYRLMQLR
jgi:cobyric acid synthase CobQ/L-threonine-O-3-phosphate decarboxylase